MRRPGIHTPCADVCALNVNTVVMDSGLAPSGAPRNDGGMNYPAFANASAGNGPSTRSTSAESQYSLISLTLPFSSRQTMQ
jgi:hypothetical protein